MAKKSKKNRQRAFIAFIVLWVIGMVAWYVHGKNFAVLNPKGMVALKERNLMLVTVGLGALVLVPVFIMTAVISIRYREGNTKAKYSPELTGNRWAETLWWGIPSAIILVLSVITWNSSHALDPRQQLDQSKLPAYGAYTDITAKPLNVQVIALDWKWLFIYPQFGIASVNELDMPVGLPVNFSITSDAPMNSFWIPQLGGQIYAMPGMQTQLHLVASKIGTYDGSSANLSGDGFAGMRFKAIAESQGDFSVWVRQQQMFSAPLNLNVYRQLAKPSYNNSTAYYGTVDSGLFDHVLLKYMVPGVN